MYIKNNPPAFRFFSHVGGLFFIGLVRSRGDCFLLSLLRNWKGGILHDGTENMLKYLFVLHAKKTHGIITSHTPLHCYNILFYIINRHHS